LKVSIVDSFMRIISGICFEGWTQGTVRRIDNINVNITH